jgi:D-glucosaminate-6-phosphate ammonia-lyase
MTSSSRHSVSIEELQGKAGALIREVTGAEAGLVTSGAFAGLTLAAAAVLAGLDVGRMNRLPDTQGMPQKILVARPHRNSYDKALLLAGARLVEVGYDDRVAQTGVRGVEAQAFTEAIDADTAGIFYLARPDDTLALEDVVRVAHAHHLPVIVDAAAQLPPRENLRKFIAQGADLVVFSGGKAIGGPQGTGILCGRADLVASAGLQMLDMDVAWPLWEPPSFLLKERLTRVPYHGIGRGFKVSKEEIVGLMVALQRFVTYDSHPLWQNRLEEIAGYLPPGVGELVPGEIPLLIVDAGSRALEIVRECRRGRPPIFFNERLVQRGKIIINPFSLQSGEERMVGERLAGLLE